MIVWFHGADSRPLKRQVSNTSKMYMLQYKTAVMARYSQQKELVFRSIYTVHTCISAFQIKKHDRPSQETINLLLTTERYIILDQWILMEWTTGNLSRTMDQRHRWKDERKSNNC